MADEITKEKGKGRDGEETLEDFTEPNPSARRDADTFARLKHHPFPGGHLLRTPALVLGMAYYRLKDLL